jgi:hypothetical protein
MKVPNYFRFLKRVRKFNTSAGELTLTPKTIGKLVLPTGKLVACDPICGPESPGFTADLRPGSYPVILCFADSPAGGRRVAYAMLRLQNINPVRWELATSSYEDVSTLKEGQYFGYLVDSGIGCFMDEAAGDVLIEGIELGNFQEYFAALLIEAMSKSEWVNFIVDESTGANVMAFSSGLGDGIYGTYFGYDEDDDLVCAVTDFNVLGKEAETLFD